MFLLGLVTAKEFAPKVIIVCRFLEEGVKARKEIIKRAGNENVVFKLVDLSSVDSVHKLDLTYW